MIITNDKKELVCVRLIVGMIKCETKISSLWGNFKSGGDRYLLKSMEGVKRIKNDNKRY